MNWMYVTNNLHLLSIVIVIVIIVMVIILGSKGLTKRVKALEPYISRAIMKLHYRVHHQAYVNNLNNATAALAAATETNSLTGIITALSAINFNGGGHINHSLFWKNLTPPNSTTLTIAPAASPLLEAIVRKWGSRAKLIAAFNKKLGAIQGSGWGWLVKNEADGALEIVVKPNQDPILAPQVPIIGVDAWEHSYYLQYKSNRSAYLAAIWNVINWSEAERRYGSWKRIQRTSINNWDVVRR